MSLSQRRNSNAARVRSGLNAPEQRDWPKHRKWIRGFKCAVCYEYDATGGFKPECAHVRTGTDGGTGIKPHDCFTLPLCADHHRLQHDLGETTFAKRFPRSFPQGMRAKALEFARQSPVAEIRDRARLEREQS